MRAPGLPRRAAAFVPRDPGAAFRPQPVHFLDAQPLRPRRRGLVRWFEKRWLEVLRLIGRV